MLHAAVGIHPHGDTRARRHHRRSELRRGRPPCTRWGNDTVLLGDYLYIVDGDGAHARRDRWRLLCDVTLKTIEGELYQLTKNGDADITEEETSTSSAARPRTCWRLRTDRRRPGESLERAGSRRCASTDQPRHRVPDRGRLTRFPRRCPVGGEAAGSDLREGRSPCRSFTCFASQRRHGVEHRARDHRLPGGDRRPVGGPAGRLEAARVKRLRVPASRGVRRAREEAALRVSAQRRTRRAARAS